MTHRRRVTGAGVALLVCAGLVLILLRPDEGVQERSFTVPEGFTVEMVAGPDLVSYPMFATFDERGRLFVSESTGPNDITHEEALENPSNRISLLEDTDGDGFFDKSTIFADKLPLPQGGTFYRGSFYASAAPDFLRLTDTDQDGRADQKEVLLTGWNLGINANSLIGPFLAPDGWFYLTSAARGFEITTREGVFLKGKTSRIWRCRPDGTELEWISAGGFANPIELAFTAAGEPIGTMTYFTDPRFGERDSLTHWVKGGVYPKPHFRIEEDKLKRTGSLMPVVSKFARVAHAGLMRYRGSALGSEYRGNLFSAQFNTHRVMRHQLSRQGGSFETKDEDFLVSSDPDFHPTDVLEDADGSLLVLDTGGWFIYGCPLSRITKPQFRGGIYRVRRTDAAIPEDPRGKQLGLEKLAPAELVTYLEDPRTAVVDRATELLVDAGKDSVDPLMGTLRQSRLAEIRCRTVFALSRIETGEARAAVRNSLGDPDPEVRVAAARAVGLAKDIEALPELIRMVRDENPAVRRQVATALGQMGDQRAAEALLDASVLADGDRFVDHSIIYALISLGARRPAQRALQNPSSQVQRVALIALDQMDGGGLRPEDVVPLLGSKEERLRQTAIWVASHHPDWAPNVTGFLSATLRKLELPQTSAPELRELITSLCSDKGVQSLVAELLGDDRSRPEQRLFLMESIEGCRLDQFPKSWIQALGKQLGASDASVRSQAIRIIRSWQIDSLTEELRQIADDESEKIGLRTAALGALVNTDQPLSDSEFEFLVSQLNPQVSAPLRLSAAEVLERARLADEQLQLLARTYLPQADTLILVPLLSPFGHSRSEEVGEALVSLFRDSPELLDGVTEQSLTDALANFPGQVQRAAGPLTQVFQERRAERIEMLHDLAEEVEDGDPAEGRKIFFGSKVGCGDCHTIGKEGGHVGPDLTSVGAIRSRHDLLESLVFPSASLVEEHQSYRVQTKDALFSGLRGPRTPEAIVFITGVDSRVRIPRADIVSMEPSPVSMMPEGLDRLLSRNELANLLAFLQVQKHRPEVAGD